MKLTIKLKRIFWLPIKYKLVHIGLIDDANIKSAFRLKEKLEEETEILLLQEKLEEKEEVLKQEGKIEILNWLLYGDT